MTQQVRTSYRRHPRAAWGLAIALAVAVAAVVIPLANAGEKTFTVSVAPTSMCTSLTEGGASTQLTLKNTGSPQTMGSAEVYFPPNTVSTVFLPSAGTLLSGTTTTTSGGPKDVIRFNTLGLAPGQQKLVTVKFKANANFSTSITAVVKQANNFNDSGGGANLFTVQGSFPTLRVVQCVTVSGRVFQDRNLDFGYILAPGSFDGTDLAKVGWTVNLYSSDVGAPSPYKTTTTASDGTYSFTGVPTLSDYKICVVASPADAGSKWGLQSPVGNTQCGPISTAPNGPTSSAGKLLPNLSAAAASPGTDFQVVPVIGPFGTSDESTVGGYKVTAGSNPNQKSDQLYVQDTWVDTQGHTNFRFSPILPCGTPGGAPSAECGKHIYLLEELTADIQLSKLAGQQASLRYDDVAPFTDSGLHSMPYCTIDPRPQSGTVLATSGVLPGSDTSCIVEAEQNTAVAGGTVHVVYLVYTSYDGGRQVT